MKVKVFVCEQVKELYEDIYSKEYIKKSADVFCCYDNEIHNLLFSMCLYCQSTD